MRRTSSETIYDELKDDIIFLRLKPGEEICITKDSTQIYVTSKFGYISDGLNLAFKCKIKMVRNI